MSIRTLRPESIMPGIVLRKEAGAPPVFRRSGHRMIRAVTESLRLAGEMPGRWTFGRRRAESEGGPGGRPQILGSFAGDRCRPCRRWGRKTPTLPQRIVILAMINRERRRGFATGIRLSEALKLSKQPGPLQSSVEAHRPLRIHSLASPLLSPIRTCHAK